MALDADVWAECGVATARDVLRLGVMSTGGIDEVVLWLGCSLSHKDDWCEVVSVTERPACGIEVDGPAKDDEANTKSVRPVFVRVLTNSGCGRISFADISAVVTRGSALGINTMKAT